MDLLVGVEKTRGTLCVRTVFSSSPFCQLVMKINEPRRQQASQQLPYYAHVHSSQSLMCDEGLTLDIQPGLLRLPTIFALYIMMVQKSLTPHCT